MNNKNKKSNGFALTPVLLAVALGSVLTAGTMVYFHNVDRQSDLTKDADLIVHKANLTSAISGTATFSGDTFNDGSTSNGVVSVKTDANTCSQLKAKLAPMGSVSCGAGGSLLFKSNGVKSAFASIQQPELVAGSSDSVTSSPVSVGLKGSVSLASVEKAPTMGSTTSTFQSHGTAPLGLGSLSGTNGGSVSTSVNWGFSTPQIPTVATGNATVTPPPPAYPVPSSPKVLYSMWGVNVVVSPDANAASYQMGITCGINPPASVFNATVQNVPASGLYSSVITENLPTMNTGYYFLPIGTAYTVIGGMANTGGSTQVANMTKALPQSTCQIPNSFGVWNVQVKVRACNVSGQCSAWSPDFGQFCNFNRC